MDAIEQLKDIGLEKISKETHIYTENLKSLLEKDFDALHKTKIFGLIKILERTYKIDLSDLKKECQTYLDAQNPKEEKLTIVAKEEDGYKKSTIIYIALFLIALAFLSFFILKSSPDRTNHYPDLNVVKNSTIMQETKETLKEHEVNETSEDNSTVDLEIIKDISPVLNNIIEDKKDASVVMAVIETPKTGKLYIEPLKNLWVGIIYLDNYSRKSYLSDENIVLNSKRRQLVLAGHNQFRIFNNFNSTAFDANEKVRFLYQDGILREIDIYEFEAYNEGLDW